MTRNLRRNERALTLARRARPFLLLTDSKAFQPHNCTSSSRTSNRLAGIYCPSIVEHCSSALMFQLATT
jgi:hypothetical protein